MSDEAVESPEETSEPWQDGLAELWRRRELAQQMGGPDGVARQHERGKLTVRERIEELADPGSFREFGVLTGSATCDSAGQLASFMPKPHVDGMCTINDRKVVVTGSDFTVRGGSASGGHGALGTELPANERALRWRLPYVRLLDSAGGSVRGFEDLGRTYLPDGNVWSHVDVELLDAVPVVSAVMGSVGGLPAINACLAHWNIMVRGTSQLFPGGPPVVKAALGLDVSREELGGSEVHVGQSGVVDNVADDEKDALEQIRRFLSYLPSSSDELPQRADPREPVGSAKELRALIPENRRKPFDARRLLDLVLDEGSLFEIASHYGAARITGLARVDGYPVGVMANDPTNLGGSTDMAAGEKVIRLLQLCDLFHLPLVSFADEPGFMVGPDSEKRGIERAGARLVWTVCRTRMPFLTFVVGRLYGVAGQCHHRPSGMFRRYAWPSALWGSMHITGGASAAYRREIEEAADPDAKRSEIERRLQMLASPFKTAEATGQDIVDPAETRELLSEFVLDAQRVLARQLGPPTLPYRP